MLGIRVQPFKLRVLGSEISVLRLSDMVPWLASCPGQRYVSLLGPEGPEGCRSFWREAARCPWGEHHPVVAQELCLTSANQLKRRHTFRLETVSGSHALEAKLHGNR